MSIIINALTFIFPSVVIKKDPYTCTYEKYYQSTKNTNIRPHMGVGGILNWGGKFD